MILVTGAGGKTGRAVVRELSRGGETVRALARRPEQEADLRDLGAAEVAVGDLLSVDDMVRAMSGVRAAYLIAPNIHPEESRIGEIAITAAHSAGVGHLVYHSVLHPQIRQMPHHWQKLEVEERLFESGLGFTILQPGAYMQNVLAYWNEIVDDGVYRVPYGDRGALSLVALDDVAEVAAKVLTEPRHAGATYELAGPEALTPARIAQVLSESLSRPVIARATPLPEWVDEARAAGIGDYALDALTNMFRYYEHHGLRGNPHVLESLLGRRATMFSEFVDRALRAS